METYLTAQDRCDRCGPVSQAWVIAIVNGVRLLFCGHHFTKHERAIRIAATRVEDRRDEIPA